MKNIDPTIPAEDQEKIPEEPAAPGGHVRHWQRFKLWYGSHKRLAMPLTVLVLLIILAGIPWTRFKIAGLVLKKNFTVQVTDSTARIPVSGATVTSGSVSAVTDGAGQATLKGLKVGSRSFSVSKKYYAGSSVSEVVPILKQKNNPNVLLAATGRQARIHVVNLITKKVLPGVSIQMAGASAKTDTSGNALVVLPVSGESQKATLSLNGYNNTSGTVQASNSSIKETDFSLTSAGKVYFLSKLSGTIDVVKTDLDGAERQTVLAGTGQEDDQNTVLLASRDWQYLALLSARSGTQALYVINTNDDQLLDMDQGDASFNPVGWYKHYFIYTVSRNGYNSWQPDAFSIKSYNADTGQILTLANSAADGTDDASAEYQSILYTQIIGDSVVYSVTWYKYPGYLSVSGKQNTLVAIHPDGTDSRQLKSVDAATLYISNLKLDAPRKLDFGVYNTDYTQSSTTYYVLDKNGNVTQSSTLTEKDLEGESSTYLLSPSGDSTLWQQERDGKNTLFTGDQDAGSPKQIATLSDYSVYGWYTDNYILLSQNGSELYIAPAGGIKSDSAAIKITDYHKPDQSFFGYGGGYGGL